MLPRFDPVNLTQVNDRRNLRSLSLFVFVGVISVFSSMALTETDE